MKYILISLLLFLSLQIVSAQNVGIGTTTPQTKLHIISPTDEVLRLEANNPFVSLYSSGLYNGYFWKSPNSIELGSATGSNLAITLATNGFQRFYIGTNGNVGIGNNNPNAPLQFASNILSRKIVLYESANNDHQYYGFGINGGMLRYQVDATAADHVFYAASGANTSNELFRIKGNGNIGLGVSDPAFKADIFGRVRIRTGTDGEAGIWLNNSDNTALHSFIGLENDNYVGFYGASGAGWKFGMNTQTGALKINGTEGQPKQLLVSNGSSSASSWTNAGNILQSFYTSTAGGLGQNITSTSWVDLTGLTFNITLAAKSRLIISATFTAKGIWCPGGGCTGSCAQITLEVNGNLVTLPFDDGITRIAASPNADGSTSISNYFYDINAGTYIIKFKAKLGCDQSYNLIDNLRCSQATIIALPID